MSEEQKFNAADEGQVKSRKRKDERVRDRDQQDIRFVMETVPGRRVMRRLQELAGVHRTSYSGQSLQMAFNEGARNLGLVFLADMMGVCPDLYMVMLTEAKEQDNV